MEEEYIMEMNRKITNKEITLKEYGEFSIKLQEFRVRESEKTK